MTSNDANDAARFCTCAGLVVGDVSGVVADRTQAGVAIHHRLRGRSADVERGLIAAVRPVNDDVVRIEFGNEVAPQAVNPVSVASSDPDPAWFA